MKLTEGTSAGKKTSGTKNSLQKKKDSSNMKASSKKVKFFSNVTDEAEAAHEFNAKSRKPKELKFTTASSLGEIKKESKDIRKMSFADRLKLEQLEGSEEGRGEVERGAGFGQRQISYTVHDPKQDKFQKLREKNEQHKKERKKLVRPANRLKGRRKLE